MENRRILIYFLIATSSLSCVSSTHTCLIENLISNCRYTVLCELSAGSASNPSCSSEPHVIFVLRQTTANILSVDFFRATNFDSRVREIEANGNNWNTISESSFMHYYSKTERMDLSNNKIVNIQDMPFNNLIYLQSLNLSRNEIYHLDVNSLYTHDNEDSEIVVLDLSHNKLEKLPTGLFNYMNKLQLLQLQNNEINHLPDDVFMNLRNLTLLNLNNNSLSAFNMTLINLKNLEKIYGSFNKLKKLSGYELNPLTALIYANFSNNEIEIVESKCFNQAFNLEVLDLKNNKIKSIIENVMLINNVKLRYLDLENNFITTIEDNAFKHNNLSYLSVEKNKISGPITEATFAGLKDISILNLYDQGITSLGHGAFSEMINLKVLNLSRNSISAINVSCFGLMLTLSVLDLSYNNISDLLFVKNSLTNLTELILNNNQLQEIGPRQFVNQTQLKKLDLSMNKIKIIEQFSLPLENLQYLNISGNQLIGTILPHTFSPAKYLRYLDLSGFLLRKVSNMSFINMPVLARMNLSYNVIHEIGLNNFYDMNNMYSLDISNNRMKNLEITNGLNNLKSLYLNNNNLKGLPKVKMPGVLYLNLSYNNITNVSEEVFGQLKNLKALHMSNNRIKNFNNNHTNSLQELTDLSLSKNDINNINLSYFRELISFDINSNKLSNIDKNSLKNMDNLQALDFSNNNITKLPPGTFQDIKILKLLNLSSNHITSLRYGSLRGLHRTEVLDLSKNDIADLDVDTFHECVELKKLIIDNNKIKILDFERLLVVTPKLSSVSLGGNPISCKEIVRNVRLATNNTFFRPVEVTSIDKIYHEDNVHGIQCGKANRTVPVVITPDEKEHSRRSAQCCFGTNKSHERNKKKNKKEHSTEHSSALVYFVYFIGTVVIIMIIAVLGVFYLKYYRRQSNDNFSELRLRRPLELSNSNIDNDLLG